MCDDLTITDGRYPNWRAPGSSSTRRPGSPGAMPLRLSCSSNGTGLAGPPRSTSPSTPSAS